MPVVLDAVTRKNNAPTPTAYTADVYGAPQIVATFADLGTLPTYIRVEGLQGYVLDTGRRYRLAADLGSWNLETAVNYQTSGTSATIGLGTQALTTNEVAIFLVGQRVRLYSAAAPSNYMEGAVSSASGTDLQVTSDYISGSGTFTDWVIVITSGKNGATGGTGATGPGYYATSSTSYTIGGGDKTFIVATGLAYSAGDYIRLHSAATPTAWVYGIVLSYSSVSLGVSPLQSNGSGTYTDWVFSLSGKTGDAGSTGDTGPTGPGYSTTSATSYTIGGGDQTFTVASGLAYTTNDYVRLHSAATPTAWVYGSVLSYSGTSLGVTPIQSNGSGTYTDWVFSLSGRTGDTGPTGPTAPVNLTWFVDLSNATGTEDGSQAHPYSTIQEAVTAAAAAPLTSPNIAIIVIAPGDYTGAGTYVPYAKGGMGFNFVGRYPDVLGVGSLQQNLGAVSLLGSAGSTAPCKFENVHISLLNTDDDANNNINVGVYRSEVQDGIWGKNMTVYLEQSRISTTIHANGYLSLTYDAYSVDWIKSSGVVLSYVSGTSVTLYGASNRELQNIWVADKSPTGFTSGTSSSLTFTDATRTFTTSTSSTFYYQGRLFTKSATEDYVWANSEGLILIYYSETGVLSQAPGLSTIISVLEGNTGTPVALLYWDATNAVSTRRIEYRHGVTFAPPLQLYLHRYLGMVYESGGALGDFTITTGSASLATHSQFSVGNVVISDSDLRKSITDGSPQDLSPVASIPIFWQSGAGAAWRMKAADTYPLIYSGSGGYTGASGRIAYNQYTGGAWQLTEVPENACVLVHYFATTDLVNPIIGVVGDTYYDSPQLAKIAALSEMNTTLQQITTLSLDSRPLASVIFQSNSTYTNAPKAKVVVADNVVWLDWRTYPFSANQITAQDKPSGVYWVGASDALSLLVDGATTVLTPAVEQAFTSLLPSHKYMFTVSVSVTVYLSSDHTRVSQISLSYQEMLDISSGGVLTETLVAQFVDYTGLIPDLSGIVVAAVSGTNIAIQVTRPTTIDCVTKARAWIAAIEDIT